MSSDTPKRVPKLGEIKLSDEQKRALLDAPVMKKIQDVVSMPDGTESTTAAPSSNMNDNVKQQQHIGSVASGHTPIAIPLAAARKRQKKRNQKNKNKEASAQAQPKDTQPPQALTEAETKKQELRARLHDALAGKRDARAANNINHNAKQMMSQMMASMPSGGGGAAGSAASIDPSMLQALQQKVGGRVDLAAKLESLEKQQPQTASSDPTQAIKDMLKGSMQGTRKERRATQQMLKGLKL